MKYFSELNVTHKRVLIREDLNVPLDQNRQITSDARIDAALPSIRQALAQRAAVIIVSHLGRPQEGCIDPRYSLAPVAQALSKNLDMPVPLLTLGQDNIEVQPGQVVLLENIRFSPGEKANDDQLAQQLANLCDVFVMDAFATAHRAQASTVGVAKFAPVACAGPLLIKELDAFHHALSNPKHPLLAIVGGSKVSTKLEVLDSLLDKVDQLIVGGGIANTFLAAAGYPIGNSLYEPELIATAKKLLEKAKQKGATIPLPVDVVTAKELSESATPEYKQLEQIQNDDCIFDIGAQTAEHYQALIANASTIIWNGPVGVFELPAFAKGTEAIANAIATSPAFSIAGGGDTLAAIDKFHLTEKISYTSTGGGAFLELLEGKTLPAIEILETKK